MKARGEYSLREISTQGASWRAALSRTEAAAGPVRDLWARNHAQPIVFIGCGSTHYLAQFASAAFQQITGRACRALPSSELLWQQGSTLTAEDRPLIVALSRSGETSETLWAIEALRARGSDVLAIGCYADSPVGRAASYMLELPEGREESYAQTRSFASMLLAVQMTAALLVGNGALAAELRVLPELADALIARAQPLARRWGRDETLKRVTFLGSGALYGLTNEATVKMKEMALQQAEGYHFLEFRHGPMALVDREHLVVGLLSESMCRQELAVLHDLGARGAKVLAIANRADGLGVGDDVFALDAPVSEDARPVLYLPFVQLLAYHRAMGRGLDPDRPRNVTMAITLDRSEIKP